MSRNPYLMVYAKTKSSFEVISWTYDYSKIKIKLDEDANIGKLDSIARKYGYTRERSAEGPAGINKAVYKEK